VTGFLNADQARVALVLNTVRVESLVRDTAWMGGRPPCSLKASARAFLVKAVLNIPTTKDLVSRLDVDFALRTLCGFGAKVPSESTFSRHFKTLADSAVLDTVHEGLVRAYVGKETVHHLCRDSSAIEAREAVKVKRERTSRREKPAPPSSKEPSRIPDQLTQDYRTSLAQLPRGCDIGTKTGSKGRVFHWIGFKLHLDVADGGLPISAFTTSASVHDSQLAIPLSRMSGHRVGGIFYEVMDKAYDASAIKEEVLRKGSVPLIQPANRGGVEPVPFDPAQERRFKIRTTVERTFSDVKDNHGGRTIRVRGPEKVHTHLMFGVLSVFALVLSGLR
jgi:transposase